MLRLDHKSKTEYQTRITTSENKVLLHQTEQQYQQKCINDLFLNKRVHSPLIIKKELRSLLFKCIFVSFVDVLGCYFDFDFDYIHIYFLHFLLVSPDLSTLDVSMHAKFNMNHQNMTEIFFYLRLKYFCKAFDSTEIYIPLFFKLVDST